MFGHVWHNSVASDAFAKVIKMANHTGLLPSSPDTLWVLLAEFAWSRNPCISPYLTITDRRGFEREFLNYSFIVLGSTVPLPFAQMFYDPFRTRQKSILVAFKSHTDRRNAQRVNAPTTMILLTIASTCPGFKCFGHMRCKLGVTKQVENFWLTFILWLRESLTDLQSATLASTRERVILNNTRRYTSYPSLELKIHHDSLSFEQVIRELTCQPA